MQSLLGTTVHNWRQEERGCLKSSKDLYLEKKDGIRVKGEFNVGAVKSEVLVGS